MLVKIHIYPIQYPIHYSIIWIIKFWIIIKLIFSIIKFSNILGLEYIIIRNIYCNNISFLITPVQIKFNLKLNRISMITLKCKYAILI